MPLVREKLHIKDSEFDPKKLYGVYFGLIYSCSN